MDTTDRYIEMCKQANEIQKLWLPEYGEVKAEDNTEHVDIWLPRQDQLQRILLKVCTQGYLVGGFHMFFEPEQFCPDADEIGTACDECQKLGIERRTTYISMEQLWLAFTMSELFGKKWDGSTWVEEPLKVQSKMGRGMSVIAVHKAKKKFLELYGTPKTEKIIEESYKAIATSEGHEKYQGYVAMDELFKHIREHYLKNLTLKGFKEIMIGFCDRKSPLEFEFAVGSIPRNVVCMPQYFPQSIKYNG